MKPHPLPAQIPLTARKACQGSLIERSSDPGFQLFYYICLWSNMSGRSPIKYGDRLAPNILGTFLRMKSAVSLCAVASMDLFISAKIEMFHVKIKIKPTKIKTCKT